MLFRKRISARGPRGRPGCALSASTALQRRSARRGFWDGLGGHGGTGLAPGGGGLAAGGRVGNIVIEVGEASSAARLPDLEARAHLSSSNMLSIRLLQHIQHGTLHVNLPCLRTFCLNCAQGAREHMTTRRGEGHLNCSVLCF